MTNPTRCRGRGANDRDPLLLVHGFAATRRVWEPVAAELRTSFQVFAPTLPGHFEGQPLPPDVAPGIEPLADWLETELDALGWDSAHVAGNSLGGWLALELAKRGRARSVVALAPAGGWRPGSPAARRIQRTFTARHRLGRPLLPYAERLCGWTLGRRLLFGGFSAHPERLEPAHATYASARRWRARSTSSCCAPETASTPATCIRSAAPCSWHGRRTTASFPSSATADR
jgi:pimeloyl-ACP methyl ester carboxylesterase